MTTGLYKKGLIFGIICLFIGAGIVPHILGSNSIHARNTEMTDDVPEWEKGTVWTYSIDDIVIEISDDLYPGLTLNVQGSISDLPLRVEDVTSDTYELSFNAKIQGEVSVETSIHDITFKGVVKSGWLLKPTISGLAIVRKSDLALEQLTLQFSGSFLARFSKPIVLPALRVPVKISLSTEFSTPCSVIDFPLSVGKAWGISETVITLDGEIQSIWLRPLNFIHKIARLLNLIPEEFMDISDMINDLLPVIDIGDALEILRGSNSIEIPETPPLFYCASYETINVPAGSYDAYKIVFPMDTGYYCYAPEAKNIVKIEGNVQQLIPYIENISMELLSINES